MAEVLISSYENEFTHSKIDTDYWRGQTFTTPVPFMLTSVSALCYREGTVGQVNVGVYGLSGGEPDLASGALASGSFDGNTLTTNTDGEWKKVTFATPVLLDGQYVILYYYDNQTITVDVEFKVDWVGLPGESHFYSYNDGALWSEFTDETMLYRVYGTPPDQTNWLSSDCYINSALGQKTDSFESVSDYQGGAFTTWWRTQTFTTTSDYDVTHVSIYCEKSGSPGILVAEIYNVDINDDPDISGGALASGTYNTDNISGLGWIDIPVSGAGSSLTSGTRYAIVWYLQNSGLDSGNSIDAYGLDGTGYPNGESGRNLTSGVGSWTMYSTDDFAFRIYADIPPPTITFTSDCSIIKDGETKTFTAGASLLQDGVLKTTSIDVNIIKAKQTTVDVILSQDGIAKTFTANVSLSKDGVTKSTTIDCHIYEIPNLSWPTARPEAYSNSLLWDEDTKSWYAETTAIARERLSQAGGRYRNNIIFVSDQGRVYFGSI
jgi:hypothetical protein